jgi:hypothetical protein
MTWNDTHGMAEPMKEIMDRGDVGKEHRIQHKSYRQHDHNRLLGQGNIMLAKDG